MITIFKKHKFAPIPGATPDSNGNLLCRCVNCGLEILRRDEGEFWVYSTGDGWTVAECVK